MPWPTITGPPGRYFRRSGRPEEQGGTLCGRSQGAIYRRCPAHPPGSAFFCPAWIFYRGKDKGGCQGTGETLKKISAERIQTELVKLLVSPNPQYLKTAWELGLTKIFLWEFDKAMETPQENPHHCYNVGEHTLKAMEAVKADRILRLTLLFHDLGKAETRTRDEKGIDHFHGHPAQSEKIARTVLKRLRLITILSIR